MNYSDLLTAHNRRGSDKAYDKLISAITDKWAELDSIIDFVRRWNSRVPIGKNKEKIKQVILSLKIKFDCLEKCNLEDIDFSEKNISIIKDIFEELSKISLDTPKRKMTLKSTGVSKLLHGINTNLFVMWDNGICEEYGCYPNSKGYVLFLKMMQEEAIAILKEQKKEDITQQLGRTIPKLIDEYNWMNFSPSKKMIN